MEWLLEFHLWDHLNFKSAGLLTSFKSWKEDIISRKKRVVSILEKYSWINIVQTEDWPWADFSNSWRHRMKRIINLLEENSILQDALDYLSGETTAQWKSIWDISQTISFFKVEIKQNPSEKLNIYNIVDLDIWKIIFSLKSDINNWLFKPSEKELKEIEELESSRKNFLKFFNSLRGGVMFW